MRETKAIARGRLSLPAGKLEPDESITEAAIREVREETGLVVEVRGLLGVFHCDHTSEHSYGVNFVFDATPVGGELTTSAEHPELVWLTLAEITNLHAERQIRGSHAIVAVERSHASTYLADATITEVPPVH